MAYVSNIIVCLNAKNDENGVCANNILTALTPEYIPGLFTFSVIIALLDIDVSQEHNFIVDFITPDDVSVVHIDGKLPCLEDKSNLPPEYKGVNIAMDWTNVNLKSSGEYKIIFTIDEVTTEKGIYVKGQNET